MRLVDRSHAAAETPRARQGAWDALLIGGLLIAFVLGSWLLGLGVLIGWAAARTVTAADHGDPTRRAELRAMGGVFRNFALLWATVLFVVLIWALIGMR